jgi:hypothetical protein
VVGGEREAGTRAVGNLSTWSLLPATTNGPDILPSYKVLLEFTVACIGLKVTWIFIGSTGVSNFSHKDPKMLPATIWDSPVEML